MTKTCSVCNEEKQTDQFQKRKASKDGLMPRCKECERKRSAKYRAKNGQQLRERHRKFYRQNREERLEKAKDYYENNKEKVSAYKKEHYQKNKAKIIAKNSRRTTERRREDPHLRLAHSVSTAVYSALKSQEATKSSPTFSALPYGLQDLVEHLEKQFDEQMCWDNYGSYWHVDHIYPQSLLPYESFEDENFRKCWALENLQPLEAKENLRKSNKVLDSE